MKHQPIARLREAFTSPLRLTDRNDRFRLVIIAGPTPAEILAEFTRLTGRAPVPTAKLLSRSSGSWQH